MDYVVLKQTSDGRWAQANSSPILGKKKGEEEQVAREAYAGPGRYWAVPLNAGQAFEFTDAPPASSAIPAPTFKE